MIGFEMTAEGSNGFRQKRGAWTEGSMMSIKALLTIGSIVNKDQQHGLQRGVVSQIEAQFKKIADSMFSSICSMGIAFTLFVKGDIRFKYYFDPTKGSDEIQRELLFLFKSTEKEIGSQVMIYFCRIIQDFVRDNFDSNDDLILTINIDL